ncbi:MAG: hypothetical protein ACLGGV_07735 [Bacteroidia bacterium]
MANPNISVTLTEAQKKSVKDSLKAVQTVLNFTVNLTPKQRQGLTKMGQKSVSFVEFALQVAKEHPNILPTNFNVVEYEKDVKLSKDLLEISTVLLPLAEALSDTLLAVGSEAMTQSNKVYDLVKNAAKYDGSLNDIKTKLGERYKNQGGRGTQQEGGAE